MATKRDVSTRTRFEVFKRDGFRCDFDPYRATKQAKYFHGILRAWREMEEDRA